MGNKPIDIYTKVKRYIKVKVLSISKLSNPIKAPIATIDMIDAQLNPIVK